MLECLKDVIETIWATVKRSHSVVSGDYGEG